MPLVHLADQPVVEDATLRRECDATRLHLTEADAQLALREGAVRLAEPASLRQRPERGLPQEDIGSLPPRRALDLVDHLDAVLLHRDVEVVDVQDPGGEVVDRACW